MWLAIVLAVPIILFILGRLRARRRGPPRDQRDITYHWRSRMAEAVAWARHSDGNWCITLGRHTFVRGTTIEAQAAAHEFSHSADAHRVGVVPYVLLCLYQYVVHGYATAAVEVRAHQFAIDHVGQFRAVTQAEPWPPQGSLGY